MGWPDGWTIPKAWRKKTYEVEPHYRPRSTQLAVAQEAPDDEFLPLGLDSNRYKCCGNGVVAPVSEWIGLRLRAALEDL
jgi:site-specific DNA-cytosine methylase